MSHSFISKWKNQALFHGVDSLQLQYKGSKGYLDATSKAQIIEWLKQQPYLRIGDLKRHLSQEYGVVYASDQSYYALLKAAGLSWKKSQKKNPAKNEEQVQAKKKKLKINSKNGSNSSWKPNCVYD